MLLNETYDIAVFSANPAPIALAARIDVERGMVVVVKGTEPLEGGTDGAQGHIAANHIDNVVGILDLLDQGYPIVRQGAPTVQEIKKGKGKGAKPFAFQPSYSDGLSQGGQSLMEPH